MIRIAICDDDPQVVKTIKDFLSDSPEFNCDYYPSSNELKTSICKQTATYQIYLLDIEMPNFNGLEIAKLIRQNDLNALIVFITSHDHYVQEAFDVCTFNYLVKPIDFTKLQQVLDVAKQYLAKNEQAFRFHYNHNYYTVEYARILYIEKFKRQNVLYTTDGERYLFNMTLYDLKKHLDDMIFANVQRSIIVNLQHLLKISNGFAYLKSLNDPIYISKKYMTSLKENHLNYLKLKL